MGGRRFGRPEAVTRPTSDRVREAIASILSARLPLEGAHVLELFAGTGALSFELLSRGAASAVLVERDARVAKDIEASAASLGLAPQVTLLRTELSPHAAPKLPAGPFDVVLADPPYDRVTVAVALLLELAATQRLAPEALVMLEHRTGDASDVDGALASSSSSLTLVSRYRYGETSVSLLAPGPLAPQPLTSAQSKP